MISDILTCITVGNAKMMIARTVINRGILLRHSGAAVQWLRHVDLRDRVVGSNTAWLTIECYQRGME